MVDVENFRSEEKDRLLDQIEEMTEKRFRLAEHLLETRPWDLFFMVEMGTDRIHHAFWRFTDSEHRLFEPGNPYEHAMLDYYKRLDAKIARLLRFADDDTAVLVVSDHGAKQMDGGICVNEWLRREGYLVLSEEPTEPTRLTPDLIDWSRTVAWGEGGYYCRLFLNVAGREPEGIVAPGRLRARARRAEGEARGARRRPGPADRHGRAPGRGSVRGGARDRARPPRLLRRPLLAKCRVGRHRDRARVRERHGPDDANHAHEGLYLLVADGVPAGRGPQRALPDIAPTLLELLDEPVPAEMEGQSILRPAASDAAESSASRDDSVTDTPPVPR